MQFYRITHPDGRLEFGTVGADAKRRAKEVGGQFEAIEVDTTKPGLLTFFNDLAGKAPVPDATSTSEPVDEPIQHSHGKNEPCPRCKWTPKMCEGYVERKLRGLTIDAIKQFIETREGWELSTVVEAITHRLSELITEAKKGDRHA